MNTPQYLMTKQDKQYVRLGELASREIVKTSLICVFQTSVTTHFRQMTGHFRLSMTACFRISVTAFALSSEMHFA